MVIARQLLVRYSIDGFEGAHRNGQICASGAGYWLTASPSTLAAYAARRRRQGLTHLAAAAHQVTPALARAGGQQSLFASSPTPDSRSPIPDPRPDLPSRLTTEPAEDTETQRKP